MSEIHNIGDAWINVNTELNISVGTRLLLTNVGDVPIQMYESTTQPSDVLGKPLTTQDHSYAEAEIVEGSLDIWVRSARGPKHLAQLNVQEWR